MESVFMKGELQIDTKRGVIYFHADVVEQQRQGVCPTPLRICGLGPISNDNLMEGNMIDITIRARADGEQIARIQK